MATFDLPPIFFYRLYNPRPDYFGRGLLAFRRNLKPEESLDQAVRLGDKVPDFGQIRCPLCRWQPTASSRWVCADSEQPEYFFNGCGTVWNTFTTQGLCPGCGHQWRWTICLRCRGWSLHQAWYTNEKT